MFALQRSFGVGKKKGGGFSPDFMATQLITAGFNCCARWNDFSPQNTPRLGWVWLSASNIVKAWHFETSEKSAICHKGHCLERGNSVAYWLGDDHSRALSQEFLEARLFSQDRAVTT